MMESTNLTKLSPTRTLPSSATVEKSKTVPKPVGFFPSYTSNSLTEMNVSVDGSDPPSYSIDSQLHNQDPPPYPIDELPYRKNLPPYPLGPVGPDTALSLSFPMKIHSAYPLQERAGPSAPTICELDHKIGLTPYEREEIIGTLVHMKRTVEGKTEVERKEFSNAQKKLKELLFAARTRLTEADKDEFINEAKRIKEIKNEKDLERLKEEKKERFHKETERRRDRQAKEEDCHCDIWSIVFKIFQLGMVILAYAENKQWKTTQLFIFLCFFTTVSTICLLIFYSFGRRPPLIVLKAECIYCISCILGFYTATFTQTWRSFKMPLFGIGAMVGYALDIIRIFYRFKRRISSQRGNSTVPELRKNNDQHSSRGGGSCNSDHHHTVNPTTNNSINYSRNVFHTNISDESLLNLDFLNDNCYEKDTDIHNDCYYYNSSHHHFSNHLPTSSDHHGSSNHYSINNHFINSDYHTSRNYTPQKKMRLLLNPNAV